MKKFLLAGASFLALAAGSAASAATVFTFGYTGAFATFTVPATGIYSILAMGAQGGNGIGNGGGSIGGGLGAEIGSDFFLNAGDAISVATGGMGAMPGTGFPGGSGGGGGGSFVFDQTTATILVFAGGGGGGGDHSADFRNSGDASQVGNAGAGAGAGLGGLGTGGGGGMQGGGGGGGFRTDGTSALGAGGGGGASYQSGLAGGVGTQGSGAFGGFGGGGGGGYGGGGGGGYGGGGGGGSLGDPGGGGGSFTVPIAGYVGVSGFQSGDGNVTITQTFDVAEPASTAVVGISLAALGLLRRRAARLTARAACGKGVGRHGRDAVGWD